MSSITQNKQGLKVLIAGAFLQLFLGIIYVWSVFVAPVSLHYGWEAADVKLTANFMLCFFVIGILIGGKLQPKTGVRLNTLIGGLFVAAGMFATSFIPMGMSVHSDYPDGVIGEVWSSLPNTSIFLIYFFYGIIGGFGVGMAYNAIGTAAQKWFPKNRGFATGVVVCTFGASTVIFAPLCEMLIRRFDNNMSIVFIILAVIFTVATLAFFSFIKTPEQVAGATPPPLKGRQYTTLEMLKNPRYYLITLSLMFGTSVFFIINPSLKDLATERGLADFAIYLVMFTGIFNAVGRLIVPLLSDKIGRESVGGIILAITALGAFGLCFARGPVLIITIAAVAFGFGGFPGMYAVFTSENFGMKNFGANYGAVMVGFMLSSMLFPIAVNSIEDRILKFAVLGVLAIIGAALVVILKILNTKCRGEV
ncbi:MAG: MFS transporter [Oscillospiraceae bacterium]|jgi:OFA family oxalate/formate antiporter-like MFS transporter|nr:MFS transporter [Oscillospiraceae bacterium]